MKSYQTIEQGSRGATYQNSEDTYTVYEISTYPKSSVLSGQMRRRWMDEFESLDEAKKAYPTAEVSDCTYRPPCLSHLGDDAY